MQNKGKKYVKPEIKSYGKMEKLTLAQSGTSKEGSQGMHMST
ncbi:hypothetical protein [Methanobacterium sp. ACI-7]